MVQPVNVAVIGGGTGGLLVPFGLEGTGVHCDLFEARKELGGNVRTKTLEGHIVETGAEFVGKRTSYPTLWKICDILGIMPKAFKLSTQIINHDKNINVTLPPVLFTAENDGNCCSCFGWFASGPQKGIRVEYHSLFKEVFKIIDMSSISHIASDLPSEETKTITLREACDRFVNQGLFVEKRREFIDEVLIPMIAASYGTKISEIGLFGCHEALNYLNLDNTWYEIEKGWSSLLSDVKALCKDATFNVDNEVREVRKVLGADGIPRYNIMLASGCFVMDLETNQPKFYDDVVFATPLDVLRDQLLPEDNETQVLKKGLQGVSYYPTKVVYSHDTKYQSTTGAVARVDVHGDTAIFSVTKEWKYKNEIENGGQPIVKTWCYEGFEPENIIHTEYFRHLKLNDGFRTAQITIKENQGQHGLYFSGAAASFNDSNESACRAAIEVAYRIAKKYDLLESATYLEKFIDEKNKLRPEHTDQLRTFSERNEQVRSGPALAHA